MRGALWCLAVWLLACAAAPARAQAPVTPFFRLFLVDGAEVSVYGEFTRLDDQVVASVPVGAADAGPPALETITLPADRVDWARTNAYLEAVRLAQYTASSAERDYAAFADEIAQALSRVSATQDPLERIALVNRARTRLAEWPRQHFGYRQAEAAAMLGVLDEVLVGLRAAAGEQQFSLVLVAGSDAAPVPPDLHPAPQGRDLISQALVLARHVGDPAARALMLGHALRMLEAGGAWSHDWGRDTRREVTRLLDAERKVARAYASLRDRVTRRAAALLTRADVRGLLALRADALERDERLGHQRPAEMVALLAHVEARLTEARQWRLEIDRWQQRQPIIEAYTRGTGDLLDDGALVERALDDVRTLAGPPLGDLDRADALLAGMQVEMGRRQAPEEARELEAVLGSALQMTSSALKARRQATVSGDLAKAWEASAAAAGALMMLERVRTDLADLMEAPAPRADARARGASR